MSGPVQREDRLCENEAIEGLEVREGRAAEVGGMTVSRVLPTKGRRTVGPWCFVDVLGPADAEKPDPMEIGPHPHIGLSTVTWLLEGEALHTDSLGTEQVIRPGQLNLMTAGHGIAHAELAARPPFRGVQMWLAQPEATRHGAPAFEHHGDLPRAALDEGEALVFAGSFADATSAARADWPMVGVDLTVRSGTLALPVSSSFEHAVVPIDGRVRVGDAVVEPGWLALLPSGPDEVPVTVENTGARLLLLGGRPLGERISMFWNFVARSHDEIDTAWRDWRDRTDRFGTVASPLERIDAPRPPWMPASA